AAGPARAQQADRPQQQTGGRAELQAHGRLRAGPRGRADRPAQGAPGDAPGVNPTPQPHGRQRQARTTLGRRVGQQRESHGGGPRTGRLVRVTAPTRGTKIMSPAETQPAAPTVTTEAEAANLLDQVIKVTRPQDEREAERTKTYFRRFLDQVVKPGQVVSNDVEANIKRWIGEVDKSLSAQLNEVMHDPAFQKLEGTWRGLHYLVHQTETGESLKVRVLNVTSRDLFKDLEKA